MTGESRPFGACRYACNSTCKHYIKIFEKSYEMLLFIFKLVCDDLKWFVVVGYWRLSILPRMWIGVVVSCLGRLYGDRGFTPRGVLLTR